MNTETITTIPLLSCPFCGSPAVISEQSLPVIYKTYYKAKCTKCLCEKAGSLDREKVVKEWNTRHD